MPKRLRGTAGLTLPWPIAFSLTQSCSRKQVFCLLLLSLLHQDLIQGLVLNVLLMGREEPAFLQNQSQVCPSWDVATFEGSFEFFPWPVSLSPEQHLPQLHLGSEPALALRGHFDMETDELLTPPVPSILSPPLLHSLSRRLG